MNMITFLIIIVCAFCDIGGRIVTLIYMTNHNKVKTLSYPIWVIIVVFVNFAWVFYLIFGKEKR